jgi:hypothetical protein
VGVVVIVACLWIHQYDFGQCQTSKEKLCSGMVCVESIDGKFV